MLRMIGKYAEERASKDNMEMTVLSHSLKNAEIPYREPLERLVFWGNTSIAEKDSRAMAGNSQFESMYNELVEQTEGVYITVSEWITPY